MKTLAKMGQLLLIGCGLISCGKSNLVADQQFDMVASRNENPQITFENLSVTPSLVKMMPGFESTSIFTLISSDDVLPESQQFVFGAQPDGAALLKNPNGSGYLLINNHEILRSVSRVYLDKNLHPKKGEYIVDAEGGMWRLCSATMATPQEHGFGPLFLTAGESGADSRVLRILM